MPSAETGCAPAQNLPLPSSSVCLWIVAGLFSVSSVYLKAVRSSCFAGREVLSGHGGAAVRANINGKGNSSTQMELLWARDGEEGVLVNAI